MEKKQQRRRRRRNMTWQIVLILAAGSVFFGVLFGTERLEAGQTEVQETAVSQPETETQETATSQPETEAEKTEAQESTARETETQEAASQEAADSTAGTEAGSAPNSPEGYDYSAPVPESPKTDSTWFDDAVFIGDSRTQGLLEYGGVEDHADFYCKTSLTVYNLFEKPKAFIQDGNEKITLEEALTRHSYKKIYLMIGINEMGTGTQESFFEAYARAVYKIRELQPDAIIFLQGIMRVAEGKNASDPIFNNTNINIRNVMIETLANDRDIFYLDVNEAVCDENGNLHADWTFDQIHLKAKYYQVWKEYLLQHGIVK